MDTPLIGTIIPFAGNFAPQGWAFCDGQVLQIAQNQALYAVLGTQYGGDGKTTFALPKFFDWRQGAKPPYYIIAVTGIYPSRD